MTAKPCLKVESVTSGGSAEHAGLRPGDCVLAIDDNPVGDIIDVLFHAADDTHEWTLRRGKRVLRCQIQREEGEPLGVDFEPMQYRKCGNRCIFCFVDQNPRGLRSTLYFKDEDYRLSFLHGNYVTLTHANSDDLERIVNQKLSPLFVSIHATDSETRRMLLGSDREDRLIQKLKLLTDGGIEVHGQIVMCPGLNDGDVLEETINTLAGFYPGIRSLSIVPVGLTRHREGLPDVKAVDAELARRTVKRVQWVQRSFNKRFGDVFVYLADEFYLMTKTSLPKVKHYWEFWQIENGVGLTRSFLEVFKSQSSSFPRLLNPKRGIVLVTGRLMAPVFEKKILPHLEKIRGLQVELCAVSNRFYGESVTVSGLLAGQDIRSTCAGMPDSHILVLPMASLNTDGLFLDDLSPLDLERELGRRVLVVSDFQELFERLVEFE